MYQETDLKFLMSVYQKVIFDFISVIEDLPEEMLDYPVPSRYQAGAGNTVNNVLHKLIQKCYKCAGTIADFKGDMRPMPEFKCRNSITGYITDLQAAFVFTKKLCTEMHDDALEADPSILAMSHSWGNLYSQALEHAIVQILRHQVMIEMIKPEEVAQNTSFYISRPAS